VVIIKRRTREITGASAQANSILWSSIRYAATEPPSSVYTSFDWRLSSSSGDVFQIGMEVMSANIELMNFHSGTNGKLHASKSV
jgi:hypothetical protein